MSAAKSTQNLQVPPGFQLEDPLAGKLKSRSTSSTKKNKKNAKSEGGCYWRRCGWTTRTLEIRKGLLVLNFHYNIVSTGLSTINMDIASDYPTQAMTSQETRDWVASAVETQEELTLASQASPSHQLPKRFYRASS